MKININNETITVKPQNVKHTHFNTSGSNTSGTNSSKQALENISNKRAHIDAIVISQMAQNLLQAAILISSRLNKIANKAVLSGTVDREKLNEALAGINTSLNELQQKEPHVSSAVQKHISVSGIAKMGINFSRVKDDFDALNKAVLDLSAGEQPDLKKIDRINNNFFNNISKINNFVDSFASGFSFSDIRNIDADNFQNHLDRTNSLIVGHNQVAINIQGNINHETVGNLTQGR